ncbi:type IV pilus assembly protein PilC [Caldanaerobius fijiensis DSM 17918]|uniref:Type IV pilus assembly protein PilC n=1 Tax=Caldanaerobius fijiensis DSM 17918 TaxID=1121256 RepID=A0A1M4U3D6_9THEO|nr:type II secretion system F family protein [Caldanaerobius fijiensis]SHE51150.1 type IV pilus assembly protein PilC [Caldanaerobius fijiensis DSM 17918]
MPQYFFRARDAQGLLVSGTIDADNYSEAVKAVQDKKVYPVEIKEIIQGRNISIEFSKVKVSDLAIFCRQFATLLNAGISIANCFDILRQQTSNKKLRDVLGQIYEDVQKGKSLSESMRSYSVFPEILINMIEAGEVSGRLDMVLDRMAVYFEKENATNQKIKAALTYPAIVSVVAVLVVIFLVSYVLPTFINMLTSAGAQLPLPTKILLTVSFILGHFWYYIFAILFLTALSLYRYIKTPEGRRMYDWIKLKAPIFGNLNRRVITSRFTRTLGVLLASGIPVMQAMQVVEKVVGNVIVAEGLKRAEEGIRQGKGLSKPLSSIGVFQPMVIQMISVGEESGMLDSLLDKTADFFDGEVDRAVSQMTTMLEPVIILVLAVVVGFIVISIVMPMFQMYNTIKY